jgi:hypothetical protein
LPVRVSTTNDSPVFGSFQIIVLSVSSCEIHERSSEKWTDIRTELIYRGCGGGSITASFGNLSWSGSLEIILLVSGVILLLL